MYEYYDDCTTESGYTSTTTGVIISTYCPLCTDMPAAKPTHSGVLTTYTTVFSSWCSTGLAPVTYTVTEPCPETGKTLAPTHVPEGFTVTTITEKCHTCEEATTAVITTPMAQPTPTHAPVSPASGGETSGQGSAPPAESPAAPHGSPAAPGENPAAPGENPAAPAGTPAAPHPAPTGAAPAPGPAPTGGMPAAPAAPESAPGTGSAPASGSTPETPAAPGNSRPEAGSGSGACPGPECETSSHNATSSPSITPFPGAAPRSSISILVGLAAFIGALFFAI